MPIKRNAKPGRVRERKKRGEAGCTASGASDKGPKRDLLVKGGIKSRQRIG